MTDEQRKALVQDYRVYAKIKPFPGPYITAADQIEADGKRIEALEAENERLRLDVETQEALQVSAYHAGLRAGWNFGVSDDDAGMQAALADTDHIKELRRIREARAALGEKQ